MSLVEEELLSTCKHGDLEVFNRLVNSPGVDINCRNGHPLREAICNNHLEIWTYLLDHPDIDPNLTDENGRTALHWANWFNKAAAAAKLVSMKNVHLNLVDKHGNTPIMMGIKYGTKDVLMVMLNCRGVDIMQEDGQGRGLEDFARESWRMEEREKQEVMDLIRLERRSRQRELTRPENSSSRQETQDKLATNEVNKLKNKLNKVLDDLNSTLEQTDTEARERWREETASLKERHARETTSITEKHHRVLMDLKSRHRKEEQVLVTQQTRQVYEVRVQQAREVEELLGRQRGDRERREREKEERMARYRRMFEQSVQGEAAITEAASTTSVLVEKLRVELECPVCVQGLSGRVWQCQTGHILCNTCYNRQEISTCPTCRSKLMGRAIAMENLVKTFRGESAD